MLSLLCYTMILIELIDLKLAITIIIILITKSLYNTSEQYQFLYCCFCVRYKLIHFTVT